MTVIHLKPPANDRKTPPMLNIPPLTLGTLAVIAAVHIAFTVMPDDIRRVLGYDLAFVAARYTHAGAFDIWAVLSPFTHIFLHGSWLHVAMNGLMLVAFGAGAERMLGVNRTAILFIATGLAGAFTQFLLAPMSPVPMIGASGALSGLFAALTIRLQQSGMMPAGRYGIWGVAALWIGLSFFTALVGGAIGIGDVAWAAHAGGFLAGIALMRLRYFA